MTVTAKPEIKSDAIYKITIRATGKQCYAVPSDSMPGAYYKTCWDEASASWTCTCKHGQIAAEYGKGASCKHTRAAQVSVLANKERRRKARADEKQMHQFTTEMEHEQRKEEQKAVPPSQKGSLNGGGKAFSLLK